MIPTETEITYFLEMYATRHFTQAALKLRVTQSALTQSILKLEEKVQAPLFYRSKKGCTPTKSGDIFHRKAQELLEHWTLMTKSIRHDQDSLTGKFRLGCHASLGIHALPPFFKGLSERAPAIEITLTHDYSRILCERILAHELDYAFVVNPVRHNDLVLYKLYEDRICLWKSKSVSKVPQQIFTDMSVAEVRQLLGKNFARFQDYKITETTSLELVRALTAEGLGIGIIPERVAQAGVRPLELFDKTLPTPRDEIYGIHRSDTLKTEAGKVIREVAKVLR